MVTCKQFYVMIAMFVITLKIQKLPCFISEVLGKDGYVLLLLYFVVELALVLLAMFIAKRTKDQTYEFASNIVLRVLKKVLLIVVAFYFLMQGVLFYEAIQDLFSHILFENLSWSVFSLLLIALVFFLANTGLKNIARSMELYSFIVFVSLIFITIFGATRTDFSNVLPFETIDIKATLSSFLDFSFWFGDFFVVLLLARNAENIKTKWTVLVYACSMLFVILMFVEFEGIYLSYASMQPSLVSVLSEQSMLGVDIGRIDWFLILLSEIGAILCSSLCLLFAKKSLYQVFPKIKQGWILAGLMLILYLLDILLLVDFRTKKMVYINALGPFAFAVKLLVTIVGIVLAVCSKKKNTQKSPKNSRKTIKNQQKYDKNKQKEQNNRLSGEQVSV